MTQYRTFRNSDTPVLVKLWNSTLTGPRAVPIPGRGTTLFEYFYLSKPFFDPKGLIFAEDAGTPVGFIHAAFARNADGSGVDSSTGVLCCMGVVPEFRRKGIGSELLVRAEDYLRHAGASTVVAGPMAPHNPFTFGLYGGGDSPGFCETDGSIQPFLTKAGYSLDRSKVVMQRALEPTAPATDSRFPAIRQDYDILAAPLTHAGYWLEAVLGPIEAVEYRLQHKETEEVVARAILWDMETFYQKWGAAGVGMIDLTVVPEKRRHGFAKYLLTQLLRHLREQPFHLFEVAVEPTNTSALGLLRGLQFQEVERAHAYRKNVEK